MTNYKKLLKTIFISGSAVILNGLITLLLVSKTAELVGTDAYGFVSLAKNITEYATIITAALNSYASRYIVIAYHSKQEREANTYFTSTIFGDLGLGTLLFAIGMLFVCFMERILQIPEHLVTDIKLLFVFVFINFWLTTVSTPFTVSANIKNKLDVAGIFKIIAYICQAAVLVLCYRLLPARIAYVGIGMMVAGAIITGSSVWMCRKYTPELSAKKSDFSFSAIKQLVTDGIWTSLNTLGTTLNHGLDLLISNLMLSPLQMGQIAVSKIFGNLFAGMFVMIGSVFEPMYLKDYAEKNKTALLDDFRLAMQVSGLINNVVFAGFVVLGMAFYKLWIPNEDIQLIYTLTVINNLTTIPGGPMQPLYYIYTLTLKKKFPTIVTIIGGVLNVVSMYFLIKYTSYGEYAVVWTTVVVMCIINFITNPVYMAHVLELPWFTFYPAIARNVISCGVIVAIFTGITQVYMPTSWIGIGISAVVLFLVGSVIHMLIVSNKNDMRKYISYIQRKRGKSCD